MDLYNRRGQELGDVERIVVGENTKLYAVIAAGAILEMGEPKVGIALDRLAVRGDRLLIQGITEDEIRALPRWTQAGERPLSGAEVAPVTVVMD